MNYSNLTKSSIRLARGVYVLLMMLLCVIISARAEIKLPAVIGDNMVLQQDTLVTLWGWCAPDEEVFVKASWLADAIKAKYDGSGQWVAMLRTLPADGKPQTLIFKGANTVEVKNILVGETWLCSGQSNMHFPVAKAARPATNGETSAGEEIAKANYPAIRFFTVSQRLADTPASDVEGQWVVCSPESVASFSAVAYFFGRELHDKMSVPVGLIHSSWGGSPAEAWMRKDVLDADPEFRSILDAYDENVASWKKYEGDLQARKEKFGQAKDTTYADPKPKAPGRIRSNKTPYKLYNAMIAPLVPYTLKGVIWYQGEANNARSEEYRRLFPALIRSWRNERRNDRMPFYFVQIAPHKNQSPEIREAQLLTMLNVPFTGMAVITDCGDHDDIHPTNKQPVGSRLAYWALAKTYGQDIPYSGPVYTKMKVEGSTIRLFFDHSEGLVAKGSSLKEFLVAGSDGVFLPAKAEITNNTVVVSCKKIKHPVAVRFAWANFPEPNLFNCFGLPASPFRTDVPVKQELKQQAKRK